MPGFNRDFIPEFTQSLNKSINMEINFHLDPSVPEALRPLVLQYWDSFAEAAASQEMTIPENPEVQRVLSRVWAYSDFIAKSCVQDPELLINLLDSGDFLIAPVNGEYRRKSAAVIQNVLDDQELMRRLRYFRRREIMRIAWRDLAGWANLDETLESLSALADFCLESALTLIHIWQQQESGIPLGETTGEPQTLVVLGMGKLGARELNFSSDIDLIFTFPEAGMTQNETESNNISNEEYFTRLARRLIKVINETTMDGFVFRVDMRLRPHGDSGPLVMSFAAVEEYYQTYGRQWERYALIKARVVAGDVGSGKELLKDLSPFVYRRYLDFGAFESLRDMKQLIETEVKRNGLDENIKLGAGGIREIEFIGQAFQLVRGGREPALQIQSIVAVLHSLARLKYLPDFVVSELIAAYTFLRRAENRLQELSDQQTHSLPENEIDRLRVASAMGFGNWQSFKARLDNFRDKVHSHFEQLFLAPQAANRSENQSVDTVDMNVVWHRTANDDDAELVLANAGFTNSAGIYDYLNQVKQGRVYLGLTSYGRDRFDCLLPLIIGAAANSQTPEMTLKRVINVIEAFARRSAYLALLVENPLALSQLVKLCAASPWIARLLSSHPVLLDELLDPRSLYLPLDKKALAAELGEMLKDIPLDDLEQQMEKLNYFKQRNALRVAAADVMDMMPLMVVSDHLTSIAEVILSHVLSLAWDHLLQRHGQPSYFSAGKMHQAGFAILAYGKLGGIELGYGSDLDLVFIHDSSGDKQFTNGTKQIDNAMFFARLGQRIIHILGMHSAFGVLYEVDVRLRPSGASGLLVSSVEGFSEYQRNQAWVWEHQALVRARVVAEVVAPAVEAGNNIARRLAVIRSEVLARKRDKAQLLAEVVAMRDRMRSELAVKKPGFFDLKQGRGGITDIEFMVQYMVLLWAHRYPGLLCWTDNIRLLEELAKSGVIDAGDAGMLSDAYRTYRLYVHRLALQDVPALIIEDELEDTREAVARFWDTFMNV